MDEKKKIRILNYLAIIFWSLIVIFSFFWNYIKTSNQIIELAKVCAREVIEKDISFYNTVAKYGGIFVADKDTMGKHNNLFDETEIITEKGEKFSFKHPIELLIESNESIINSKDISEHLTSLRPVKKENEPDPWERNALKSFEKGETEQYCIVDKNGSKVLKLMKPCKTEKTCLKCHAKDGYKVGSVRGGITVSVSMNPFEEAKLKDRTYIFYSHLMLWVIGFAGIFYGKKKVLKWFTNFQKMEENSNNLKIALAKKDKNDSLNRMTGAIAHNVNNLLTVILGSIDMAEIENNENQIVDEYLKSAKGATKKAAELTKKNDFIYWWNSYSKKYA